MAYSINGVSIKRMDLNQAWGVTPASGQISGVGGAIIQPETEVVLNLGSLVFYGIVTDSRLLQQEGETIEIDLVDNRKKLEWDTVYCYFNGIEVIEDNLNTPGIDRQKRYWHVFPDDWHAQTKTYTDDPMSAADILDKIFNADTVKFDWRRGSHSKLSLPVFQLDAITGKKLSNVLDEIVSELSLQVGLEGQNNLIFSAKGEGTAPRPSLTNSKDRSEGVALGADTSVRVVGDRNIYQDLPITLEPNWIPHFEQYWFQPIWVERVKSLWGATDQPQAEALAREITLWEYVEKTSSANSDFGIWGEVSRMEIPVWTYITDIVYKAYRIPRDYTINNIPLDSLEMREELLAGVDWDVGGNLFYKNPQQLYSDAKAFVLVQGMPLSLLDPVSQDSIRTSVFDNARDAWQPVNKFRLDTKNKGIIFEEPVFRPKTGDQALYINPNAAIPSGSQKIVVPNANFQIDYAGVKASLSFEAERYASWHGSGQRDAALQVNGINYHALLENNSWKQEIEFADGELADDKAKKAADAFLSSDDMLESGGFTRMGTTGTSLNGTISRIVTSVFFNDGGEGEGLSEVIDYSKDRASFGFQSERELERKNQVKDLFPGQSELKEAAKQLRLISKLREQKRQAERPFENLDDITKKIPGNRDCGTSYAYLDSATSYPVGMPVFVDEDSKVSSSGPRFGGILLVANSPATEGAKIPLGNQGVIPTRVQGPFNRGDALGVDAGDDFAKVGGASMIGVAEETFSGTDTLVAKVRVGGGGASATTTPFAYMPAKYTGSPPVPANQYRKFNVNDGFLFDMSFKATGASNPLAEFTCPEGSTMFAYLNISVTETNRFITVNDFSLEAAETMPMTGAMGSDGAVPSTVYFPLFSVTDNGTKLDLTQYIHSNLGMSVHMVYFDGEEIRRRFFFSGL